MTEFHLRTILNIGLSSRPDDFTFNRLYSPEYYKFPFDEGKLISNTTFLMFNHKDYAWDFKSGEVSCTGVKMELYSNQYKSISVSVGFDLQSRKLYNHVLIVPYYTKKDWEGKKRISQTTRKVKNSKDLDRYIKSLHKRFECLPKLDNDGKI